MKKSLISAKFSKLSPILVTVLAVTFFVSSLALAQWVGPSQNPPDGNISGVIFNNPSIDPLDAQQQANINIDGSVVSDSLISTGNICFFGDCKSDWDEISPSGSLFWRLGQENQDFIFYNTKPDNQSGPINQNPDQFSSVRIYNENFDDTDQSEARLYVQGAYEYVGGAKNHSRIILSSIADHASNPLGNRADFIWGDDADTELNFKWYDNGSGTDTSVMTLYPPNFSGVTQQSSVQVAGHLGVKTTANATRGINYAETFTNPTAGSIGIFSNPIQTQSAAVAIGAEAIRGDAQNNVTTAGVLNNASFVGLRGLARNIGVGNITNLIGVQTGVINGVAGQPAGITTSAFGLYVTAPSIPAGSVTNAYGIYIQNQTGATGANVAIRTDGGAVVFNESGTDSDIRFEGDNNQNLFFLDASTDRIGIGTAAPTQTLEVVNTSAAYGSSIPVRIKNGAHTGTVSLDLVGGPLVDNTASARITASDVTGYEQDLFFSLYDGTDGGTGGLLERLRIKGQTGFVGIGTGAPVSRLHVVDARANDENPANGVEATGYFQNTLGTGVHGVGGVGSKGVLGEGTIGVGGSGSQPDANGFAVGVQGYANSANGFGGYFFTGGQGHGLFASSICLGSTTNCISSWPTSGIVWVQTYDGATTPQPSFTVPAGVNKLIIQTQANVYCPQVGDTGTGVRLEFLASINGAAPVQYTNLRTDSSNNNGGFTRINAATVGQLTVTEGQTVALSINKYVYDNNGNVHDSGPWTDASVLCRNNSTPIAAGLGAIVISGVGSGGGGSGGGGGGSITQIVAGPGINVTNGTGPVVTVSATGGGGSGSGLKTQSGRVCGGITGGIRQVTFIEPFATVPIVAMTPSDTTPDPDNNPKSEYHGVGNITTTGFTANFGGNINNNCLDWIATEAGVSGGSGGSGPWVQNGTDIYYNSGRVGINDNTPQAFFDIDTDGINPLMAVGGSGPFGASSISLGHTSRAQAENSVAIGRGSGANALKSMAFGGGNTSGVDSLVFGEGYGISSSAFGSVLFNLFNDGGTDDDPNFSFNLTQPNIFAVMGGQMVINDNQTSGLPAVHNMDPMGNTLAVWGTAAKSLGGTSWATLSDARLKDISGKYTRGLADILELDPIRYYYKQNQPLHLPNDVEQIGLIAQDVQKVIPEAVSISKTDEKYLLLNSDPILLALINAIKEQQAQIEQLKAEIATLKSNQE